MSWNPWSSVSEGQSTPGAPLTAVPWGSRFALFLADPNGGVYCAAGAPRAGFGQWVSVSQGSTKPGAPVSAVPWGNGIALFLADPTGEVYSAAGDPQAGFGPWASVSQGSTTPGGVVTAVPWGNRIALFLADPRGEVYSAAGDPQAGFGPWSSVSQGSTKPGAPVCAAPWGNGIALFLADPTGEVYSAAGDPQAGFGPWASVSQGSTKPGAPVTAVPWGNGIALFLADPKGEVYSAAGDPQAGFGPWSSVSQGSTKPGAPVSAVQSGNGIALFLADPNGGIYTVWGNPAGGWGQWSNVSRGQSTPGAPVSAVPWGIQFVLFLADPNGGIYTTWGFGDSLVLGGAVGDLLEISRSDGSPWTNPAHDTSDPNWSANAVGGQTFDGQSSHPFEWVSVLNPTVEQDDQVGLAGTAIHPEDSGADLPFTHPFGGDFEFAIDPDPAYAGLLATGNKDPTGNFQDPWTVARASGIPVPSGLLGLEVDGALVPPDYRAAQGDRVAVYGRWIVDAGHKDFHAEIHPPLLMALARAVDSGDNPIPASASATTLCRLWSRPYQAQQLFSTNGRTRLPLHDYCVAIVETLGDVTAYPPVFAKPFLGSHVVAFTIRPPVPTPPARHIWEVQCSYHFTVNGSCSVQVIPSPAEPNSVLVIATLNSDGYPSLPEPPSHTDSWSMSGLLQQAPRGLDLSWYEKIWLALKGRQDPLYVRRFLAPQTSQTQDSVNVVPFTSLTKIAGISGWATDNTQPFPMYGWVRVRWGGVLPPVNL